MNQSSYLYGSTVPEITRQLLKRNVSPESKSDDPNPQRQWEAQLKKSRVRARKREADSLLIRHGGDWRVWPGDPGQGHNRTAIWSRVPQKSTPKKRRSA